MQALLAFPLVVAQLAWAARAPTVQLLAVAFPHGVAQLFRGGAGAHLHGPGAVVPGLSQGAGRNPRPLFLLA